MRNNYTVPLHGLSLGELNDKVFEAFRLGNSGNQELMPLLAMLLESDEDLTWEVRHELAAAIRRDLGKSVPGRPSIGLTTKGTRTAKALLPQIKTLSERLKIGARVKNVMVQDSLNEFDAISQILKMDFPKDAGSGSVAASDRLEKRREKLRKAMGYRRKMERWLEKMHPIFFVFCATEDEQEMRFIMHDISQSNPTLIDAEVAYLEELQKKSDASELSNLRKSRRGI